jgi:hypothetical protein
MMETIFHLQKAQRLFDPNRGAVQHEKRIVSHAVSRTETVLIHRWKEVDEKSLLSLYMTMGVSVLVALLIGKYHDFELDQFDFL